MKKGSALVLLLLAGGVVGTALAGIAAGTEVFYNGRGVTSDARMVGGKLYVPLADVARAFDLQVRKRGDGNYDLAPAGGANQIANKLVGNMGQEVFTGAWTLQVLGMERMKQRDPVYLPKEAYNHIEAGSGQEFIVLKCRVKNGTKAKDGIVLGKWDGNSTALTTLDEQSFEPHRKGYDAAFNEHFPDGARLLPGAALDFYLVFEVPQGAKPKDLVFTFIRYDDRAASVQKAKRPVDVRIHLAES